jgi:hypothetical protein
VEDDGDLMRVAIDQVGQVAVPPLYRDLAKAAAGKNLAPGLRPENLQDAVLRPSGAKDGALFLAACWEYNNRGLIYTPRKKV